MTAETLTETLSREITSCGGTSSTITRRSTRTICWMNGTRRKRPGPLVPVKRPSVKTTPRSYSRRMRMEDQRKISAKTAMKMIGGKNNMVLLLVRLMRRPIEVYASRSEPLDAKHKAVATENFDVGADGERRIGARQPDFAFDPHPTRVALPGHRLAGGADQRFAAGHHRPPARAQQHRQRQEEERCTENGGADHDRIGQRQARHPRGKHHQRADDESRNAADADGTEGADMGFGDHQADADKDQSRTGVIDRKQRQRIKRDEKTDGADEARRDGAWIEEFKDQPVDADQQKNECNVGIGDEPEQLGAPVGRHGHHVE